MKPYFYLLILIFFTACSKNTVDNKNCKYLLDLGVNVSINLSLPQYNQLQFAGNSVYIANAGNGGVIVVSTGADFYAWDASDPNHIQSDCSVLTAKGFDATCGCEDKNVYNLVTGLATNNTSLQCTLKNYRVEKTGNTLLIYN